MTDASFWPAGIDAAVSLTFDDGAPSQLTTALPCLDAAGQHGTFYLNPGRGDWERTCHLWRAAALRGHELANHTTRHPCSCNYHFDSGFCLERLDLQDMAGTIDAAEAALDELHPEGRGRRTFGYPCYQTFIGTGRGRRSYVPLVAERFAAGRGGGERPNDPALTDLHCLMSFPAEGSDADALIAYAAQAARTGAWAIFTFHGIGADHLSVAAEAFGALVDYLAAAPTVWTAPVYDIAVEVERRRRLRP